MTSPKPNYLLKAYLQIPTKWELGIWIGRGGGYHLAHSSQFHSSLCNEWLSGICFQCRRHRCRFNPWVRKIPWRKRWQPTPVFLLGEVHGQRSLVGYSPWGRKESGTTEQLHMSTVFQRMISQMLFTCGLTLLWKTYPMEEVRQTKDLRLLNFEKERKLFLLST